MHRCTTQDSDSRAAQLNGQHHHEPSSIIIAIGAGRFTLKCVAASVVSNANSFRADAAEPAAAFKSMVLMRVYLEIK